MGKIITVGNLKGGTGKSTIAVNLACELAAGLAGGSVLLIDADAQATASDWLTAGGGPPPVALLPLPLTLARDAETWVPRVLRLRERYDVIVVDLPPQLGSGIASALLLTDLLLVPVTPSEVDLRATAKALELLRRARTSRGGERPACMLVPSKVDRRTALGRRATTLLDRFGLRVGPTVRQRAAHVEAFGAGKWIGAHAPGGPAHAEIRALAEAVAATLGLERTRSAAA